MLVRLCTDAARPKPTYNRGASDLVRRAAMRLLPSLMPLLAVLLLAVTANGGIRWRSNAFENPTGNIQCRYTASSKVLNPKPTGPVWIRGGPEIICDVYSSHHFVVLTVGQGRPLTGTPNNYVRAKRLPVLGYGRRWESHGIECLSTYQGMRCWTGDLAHGFFVNAWSTQRW
jgi:hypothetical protein